MSAYVKDPEAVLDYSIDWSAWLAGDTISTLTVTAITAGITVDSSSHTATTATAWISGGTVGSNYDIRFRVVTVAGRTDDRTITLIIRYR